ncbi:MAG: EAL domain-containing protein [Thermoanaerobaculia bacterium]
MDDAVLLLDESGAIQWSSDGARELWGYEPRELRGKKLPLLLSFESRDPTAHVPARGPRRRRLEAYRRDGRGFPVLVGTLAIPSATPPATLVLVRDLSELAGAKGHLRELDKALETMQVGVAIADRDLRIQRANPALAEMFGFGLADVLGDRLAKLLPEGGGALEFRELKERGTLKQETYGRHRTGARVPVEVLQDVVRTDDGDPVGLVTICQDITVRQRTAEALRESEERFALAVAGANDGIWDWNLRTGEVYLSPRWKEMLGHAPEELDDALGEWFARVHPDDLGTLRHRLESHLSRLADHFECEHRMVHADGSYRWMLARGSAVWDPWGRATRIAGSQTDITDRKVHDPLTGLPNRALFVDRLERAQTRATRGEGQRFAVLFLDLDRFKTVNDSLGHQLGDSLLVDAAARIGSRLRATDTLARFGGDEFAVLVEDMDSDGEAEEVALRIQEALADPIRIREHELFASVSIGIAHGPAGDGDLAALLRDADTAMYRAKARGRGGIQIFTPEMRDEAVARLEIENDLRRAVERGEFIVHYQPIMAIPEVRLVGFEALVRWQHPRRGLLQPASFIRVAEETGLIVPLGLWVLDESCRVLALWRKEMPRARELMMSVNLSPRLFAQPDLVAKIDEALERHRLPGDTLKLEITEGLLIENPLEATRMISELRSRGIGVAIDDFGTGYSSLSYLNRFAIDVLKIDRSFIQNLGREGERAELVRNIVRLAADLGLTVIAEGVETSDQRDRLRSFGCELMQGYFFGHPVEDAAARLLVDADA